MRPRLIPFEEVTNEITVDPAFSTSDDADPVGIVVAGHWMDRETGLDWLLVVDYVLRKMELHDTLDVIEAKAVEWNVKRVHIELHGFQNLFTKQILNDPRWAGQSRLQVIKISRGGETFVGKARVQRLEPYYESGRIWHNRWMKDGDLELSLKSFVGGQFLGDLDDLPDALSDHVDIATRPALIDYDPLGHRVGNFGTWDDDVDMDFHDDFEPALHWEQI